MTLMEQREKELADQRQVNWDVFVASLRDWSAAVTWPVVLFCVAHALGGHFEDDDVLEHDLARFAENNGWPDTLRAVAQAMELDERLKQEAMDRR